MITFSANLIRELRGSPLTVLIAFLLLEQTDQVPITAQLLKDTTGYGDHTIADSLRALESPTRQFITHVTGGWRISTSMQLPLTINLKDREIRGPHPSSSSSDLNSINTLKVFEEEEEDQSREIRGPVAQTLPLSNIQANYDQALKSGIRDPKATEISTLHHVTPDYIGAHVNQANLEGHPIGTAIYRIIHNWALSEISNSETNKQAIAKATSKLTGHMLGCWCTDCSAHRAGMPICPNCHHIYQDCECEDKK